MGVIRVTTSKTTVARDVQKRKTALWNVAISLVMWFCSTTSGFAAFCPRDQSGLGPLEDATPCEIHYFSVMEKVVRTLGWSEVIIVIDKAAAIDVDPVVRQLHANCISTSIVEHLAQNGTSSRVLTDDVFQSISSSSGTGHFLVLGGNDFVWSLFSEVAQFVEETSQRIWVNPDYAPRRYRRRQLVMAEWLAVAQVDPPDRWNPLFSPLEHVLLIDTTCRSSCPVWTSQRSGDSTALQHVTTVTLPVSSIRGLSREVLLPNLNQGLSGRTLRVVVKEQPMLVSKQDEGGSPRYQGAFIDIIHELSIRLNFSYVLQDPPDNSWGQMKENGQWDGLIGVLTREEADLAVGAFRMLNSRAKVSDYTTPYGFENTVVIFHSDGSAEDDNDSFFVRPFHAHVYVAVGITMACVVALLLLSRCCRWYVQRGPRGKEAAGLLREAARWLMADTESVLAGLLNRSHESRVPLPRAGHVIMVAWLFVSVVVVNCVYSSQLTATLTVKDDRLPFTSLEELVSQHAYTWGISNGTATQTIIMNSPDTVYRKFFQGALEFSKTDAEVLSPREDVQLRKVLRGRYAYLTGLGRYMQYWQSMYCHLHGFQISGMLKAGVFYLQKHSPYTQLFSDTINRMNAADVINSELEKWTPTKKRCEEPGPSVAIRLEQTKTAFYCLGIGVALAIVSVTVEIWCAQIKHRC